MVNPMPQVVIRVKGAKELVGYYGKLRGRIPNQMLGMNRNIADRIVGNARAIAAPFGSGTGDLKRSIRKIRQGRNDYIVTAGARNQEGRNYAIFQERGFRPHRFRARRLNPRASMASVMPPGAVIDVSRHTPFLQPSVRKVMGPEFVQVAKNMITNLIRK